MASHISFQLLHGAGPPARFDHVMLDTHKLLFLFAGVGVNWSNLNDTWIFDKGAKTWKNLTVTAPYADPLPPLKDHSAVFDSSHNLIYIFGGKVQNIPTNDIWILDVHTLKLTHNRGNSDFPPPRYAHSSVLHGRSMYIFGGALANGTVLGDLWAYNLDSQSWKQIHSGGPSARDYHTANLLKNTMYIFGGFLGAEPSNDLWSFDLEKNEWKLICAEGPLKPRSGHASVDFHGKIFIFGGELHSSRGYANADDLWSWNPETSQWKEVSYGKDHPKGRLGTRMAALNDGVLLFGGLAVAEKQEWEAQEWFGDTWIWKQ